MDYHFKPLGKTCAATGQPLPPGSECHSILIERAGEMLRLDYSAAGWNGIPNEAIGYWKVRVPEKNPAGIVIDPEQLFRVYEQLSESPLPSQETQRYVLALWLLRKKRLQLDGSRFDGDDEYLQLSGTHGEGSSEVRNLRLPDDELKHLQSALQQQLAAEWNG